MLQLAGVLALGLAQGIQQVVERLVRHSTGTSAGLLRVSLHQECSALSWHNSEHRSTILALCTASKS